MINKELESAIQVGSSRGSHIHVTCRSVCNQDQSSLVKTIFDRLITPFRLLIAWFYGSSKDKT